MKRFDEYYLRWLFETDVMWSQGVCEAMTMKLLDGNLALAGKNWK